MIKPIQQHLWRNKEGRLHAFSAVIFDCDGLLVDTEHLKFLAWRDALASENIAFVLDDYLPLVGYSSDYILRAIAKQTGKEISSTIIASKNQKYRALQAQGVPPLSAMINYAQLLFKAKESLSIKLGLASSDSREMIAQNLKHIGMQNAFDVIVSGTDDLDSYEDSTGKNKPRPYIYLEAAKRLQVDPHLCIAIEDSAAGVTAAADAGMTAIAFPNKYTASQDFSKAAAILSSHADLPLMLPTGELIDDNHRSNIVNCQ